MREIVSGLPADLPAFVVVVVHIGAAKSQLPTILNNDSRLPVAFADQGTSPRPGHIYVAPPDRHLLVHESRLVLARGPFENGTRPAIDPLFRSVAVAYGPRSIGVVLSGALGDGSSGLKAIKRCGGCAVVQDPREAPFPEMPQAAIDGTKVDHVVSIAAMPALIARLVDEPSGRAPAVPRELRKEVEIEQRLGNGPELNAQKALTGLFTCPDCGGRLAHVDEPLHFFCEVGHSYSADALLKMQSNEIERALWLALRSNHERAALLQRLAANAGKRGQRAIAKLWKERAAEYDRYADTIRKALGDTRVEPVDAT